MANACPFDPVMDRVSSMSPVGNRHAFQHLQESGERPAFLAGVGFNATRSNQSRTPRVSVRSTASPLLV
jgi:hypothetical protein